MIIENKIEFTCELAETILNNMFDAGFSNAGHIYTTNDDGEITYAELAQIEFDTYYDINLNFIEEHEK
jgi:2',3'-cyclic-nucleotide 2'-phosphodiesterase (5'-nucleotidase family)